MSDDLPRKRIKKSGKKKKKNSSIGQWLLVAGAVAVMGVVGALGYWLLSQNLLSDPWVTFEHSAGGFSCKLPMTPERRPDWEGPQVEAYASQDKKEFEATGKKRGYVVKFVTVNPQVVAVASPQRILEKSAETTLKAFTGSILSERVFGTQDGVEFLSYKLALPKGGIMRCRYFFHRNNLQQFYVVYDDGDEDPKVNERFFSCIRLVP